MIDKCYLFKLLDMLPWAIEIKNHWSCWLCTKWPI